MMKTTKTIMQKIMQAIQKIIMAILALLLLSNLYILSMQLIFKEGLPKVFGFGQVIVISGSMQPAIDVGDMLIIREQKEYGTGDVVTYHTGKSFVTHRVIDKEPDKLITQGDQNNVADEPVALSQVVGRVVLRIPKVGDFILFLKTPFGILLLVLIGLLIIEVPFMLDKRRGKNKH